MLRDEDGLSEIVGDSCVGVPESSGEYPKYPGNPPLWGEMYRVREREGRWRMLRLPKGAPIEEKVRLGLGSGSGRVRLRLRVRGSPPLASPGARRAHWVRVRVRDRVRVRTSEIYR